jgi:hypothetical protein
VPADGDLAGAEQIGLGQPVPQRDVHGLDVHRGRHQQQVTNREILDRDPVLDLYDWLEGAIATTAGWHGDSSSNGQTGVW